MFRLVTLSSLYPNQRNAKHGIFVETRLRQLLSTGEVTSTVIAPVPWVPAGVTLRGRYGRHSRLPDSELRNGIRVYYPRYLAVPRMGLLLSPSLMSLAVRPAFERVNECHGPCDFIDAHFLHPDGVVAVQIGRSLNIPVVVTARGTDVNLLPEFRLARRRILWTVRNADAIITVSEALRQRLLRLGGDASKIITLRNGVDLEFFRPLERHRLRQELQLSRWTLLSVGHLHERKGHHAVVEAMVKLSDMDLMIVGDGPMEESLKRLIAARGLSNRVRMLGTVPQAQLVKYYNAADALVLASNREGMPNVVLESIACGTPVVATAVWGTPEVVANDNAGVLIRDRTVESIVEGVRMLRSRYPDRNMTRRYAESFSWKETVRGQLEVFRRVSNSG